MTSGSRAVIFSVCFAFAAAANAQLAETDSPSERDDRAASAPPTPGTSEEAPPAHNGLATTANSLSIYQMIGWPQTACRSNSLLESFWQESRFGPDAVGPITRSGYRPIYACDGRRAVSSRSFRSSPGAAEVCRVPARTASPIRQSRVSGRRLQRWPPTRP